MDGAIKFAVIKPDRLQRFCNELHFNILEMLEGTLRNDLTFRILDVGSAYHHQRYSGNPLHLKDMNVYDSLEEAERYLLRLKKTMCMR